MKSLRTSIAAAFAIVSVGSSVVLAQVSGASQETLVVPLGSIFEIQAVTDDKATANWVLTQGSQFIESSREHIFRTRFSKEGRYSLSAQISLNGSTTERMFTLDVQSKRPEDALNANGPQGLVSFDPPLQNKKIAIDTSRQVVTVTPIRKDINVLAFDFDITTDSNGDGNTENDEDTNRTLFRSEGNPLRIWFVGGASRTIRFGSLLKDGSTAFETIEVGNGTTIQPRPTTPEVSPIESNLDISILVLKSDNGEMQYALRLPPELSEPTLLLWDFGDGSQSMLDRPIHTYAESGKYDVRVDIRSLRTGEVIDRVTDSIMVNRLIDETVEPPTTTTDTPKKESTGSLLGLVVKLLFSLVGFGLLGALVTFVIGKIKSKGISLEKTMEMAEQVMVKTPSADATTDLPPMEIAAEEVPAEPVPMPPTEPVAPPPAEPEPAPAAPEWLQAGLQSAQAETVPEPAPPPAPEPVPVPEPEPEPVPAPEPVVDTGNAPDWLQAGMQQAEAVSAEAPVAPVAPPVSDDVNSKEEAEKEKKRRKRQRYRENVKKRKEEGQPEEASTPEPEPENLNEPVAFITAEDIEPLEQKPE